MSQDTSKSILIHQNKVQSPHTPTSNTNNTNNNDINSSDTPTPNSTTSSSYNSPTYPTFDPIIHLCHKNSNFIKSIKLNKALNLNENIDHLELVGDGCFPLFSPLCVNIIKWELRNFMESSEGKERSLRKENYFGYKTCYESPKLGECYKFLPFCYDALTNIETIRLVNCITGYDLMICPEFEMAHFVKNFIAHKRKLEGCKLNSRIDNNGDSNNKMVNDVYSSKFNKNKSQKIQKKRSKVIIRRNSVAYPYICLIKLFPFENFDPDGNNHSKEGEDFPIGHAVVLQGRLIENMAYKTVDNFKDEQINVVLCPTFQPKDVIKYEDFKFFKNFSFDTAQKLICDTKIQNFGTVNEDKNRNNNNTNSPSNNTELNSIEKYKKWLDMFYNGKETVPIKLGED